MPHVARADDAYILYILDFHFLFPPYVFNGLVDVLRYEENGGREASLYSDRSLYQLF